MKTIFHPSSERGSAQFGWLDSKHSFSFGHYYNPQKMGFGALRVLNDDIIDPGTGFGTHPHANMEIVSIPLYGALAHKDSTGTNGVIQTGDVQIMSAGSGIQHSEFNHSPEKKTNFLQIWVLPKQMNIPPRYDQKAFSTAERKNRWQIVVSPKEPSAVWINQDATFALADLEPEKSLKYQTILPQQGFYLFVISGKIQVQDQLLERRDALGVWDTKEVEITAKIPSEILLIEVPMKV